jgi:hypothetical protein
MAPLSRPVLLAALVLAPVRLLAQPEDQARADMAALKARYSAAGAQHPADAGAPVAAADPSKVRASQAAIQQAGLPISTLIDASDEGMGWSVANVADFGPAIPAASAAIRDLYAKHPSAVADAYGMGSMTNIEDTFKLFGGGNLERGCISHQTTTFEAVQPVLRNGSMVIRKIRIGTVLQHNAVIVFPKPSDAVAADPDKLTAHWKRTGVIFDAWLRQKSDPAKMTYLFKKWISFGDRPRLLRDDE